MLRWLPRLLLLLPACTVRDPLFCDELTPCRDPARPFCDLEGEHPESEGIRRTCIPEPFGSDLIDAAPGGNGAGADGGTADSGEPDADVQRRCESTDGWIFDQIDDSADVGRYNSLVIDATGTAHATYYDNTNDDLKYARKPGGGVWAFETLDSQDDAGSYSSLAVDPMAGLHVSYLGQVSLGKGHELRYAYRADGQGWNLSTADSAPFTGRYTSIAASRSTVFISFVRADGSNGDVFQGTKAIGNTTAWVKTAITATDTFRENVIVVDSSGDTHFVINDRSGSDLMHYSGTFSTIDAVGFTGAPDMAIDPADGLHVIYPVNFGVGDFALKYAYRPSGDDWTGTIVDQGSQQTTAASIAVDANGAIHVAFTPGDRLYYAYRAPTGPWMKEAVDTLGASTDNSIAIDHEGGIHIVYRDGTGTALAYAYRCHEG